MVGDEQQDLLRFVIRKSETAADLSGDSHPHLHMPVETYAVRRNAKRGRFAHVMQQGGPGQGRRTASRQPFQQQQRVHPYIAFRVVLRRLRHTFHLRHLGQHLGQQPSRIQQLEGAPRPALGEHPGQLFTHPFAAHLAHCGRQLLDRPRGRRLQLEAEARGKADASQHAQFVFGEARAGVSDRAYQAGIQVFHAAHEVKDRIPGLPRCGKHLRVQHHAVDGEVAALHILFRAVGESHRVRVPAVGIGAIAAKGGDFGHNLLVPGGLATDQDDAEMRAHGKGLVEQGEHLIRRRAGGDVEVLRLAAQQQVAHTTAHEVGLMTGGAQPGYNLRCRPLCSACLPLLAPVYYYRNVSQPSQLLSGAEGGYGPGPGSGLILAIESSCDETAAAVVERGRHTLSNIVASQIATHAPYGGVVPELASREHLRNIVPVVRAALTKAGISFADLDAIAVTEGPGLAGALLVGVAYAKSLAFALGKPLIAVNHLEGHIHAVLLAQREALDEPIPREAGRSLALVVSGGHTHLYVTRHQGESFTYRNVGATVDDAAGEAFDKVAKLLGLGYPGGPWIDALAPHGDPSSVAFTFAQIKQKAHRPDSTGWPTAVSLLLQRH